MKSIVRTVVVLVFFTGVMMSVISCGSQRMGCPGSITKSEKTEPARS